MKKLLILPGNSERNRAWGEVCAEYFKDAYDLTCLIHYDHWGTEQTTIDFEAELEKIAATAEGAHDEGDWVIFAKSIGSVLALKAVTTRAIKPRRAVFFGMPLELVADTEGPHWSLLKSFTIPAIAFHNDADPTATYAYTKDTLAAYAPTITLETLAGDTHDYLHFAAYEPAIKTFLQS